MKWAFNHLRIDRNFKGFGKRQLSERLHRAKNHISNNQDILNVLKEFQSRVFSSEITPARSVFKGMLTAPITVLLQ